MTDYLVYERIARQANIEDRCTLLQWTSCMLVLTKN